MPKKILITGASGYLAKTLVPMAAQQADIVGIARRAEAVGEDAKAFSVDLGDLAAVRNVVLTEKPDAIIHCAACNPGGTNEDMFAVNELGTGNLASAVAELGCRLVSVSSDTVLSGEQAPYADDAPASPLVDNAYAVSKARGEKLIMSWVPNAIIVRTSLIYGTNFIDRGTEGFASRLAAGQELSLFTDVIRQPVHSQALAQSLCTLALDEVCEKGVMNIAGNEALSRYTFGVRMLDYWGIDYKDQLKKVSGKGNSGLPMDLRLSLSRAKQRGLPTPGLSEVLAQVN